MFIRKKEYENLKERIISLENESKDIYSQLMYLVEREKVIELKEKLNGKKYLLNISSRWGNNVCFSNYTGNLFIRHITVEYINKETNKIITIQKDLSSNRSFCVLNEDYIEEIELLTNVIFAVYKIDTKKQEIIDIDLDLYRTAFPERFQICNLSKEK